MMPIKKLLLSRYRELAAYILCGALTTFINTAAYSVLFDMCRIDNVPSTIIAWVVAVIFAFGINKILVFRSESREPGILLREAGGFFGCRAATGLLDVAIMYVAVDKLLFNGVLMKLVSNALVTCINYVASKFYIFKPKPSDGD